LFSACQIAKRVMPGSHRWNQKHEHPPRTPECSPSSSVAVSSATSAPSHPRPNHGQRSQSRDPVSLLGPLQLLGGTETSSLSAAPGAMLGPGSMTLPPPIAPRMRPRRLPGFDIAALGERVIRLAPGNGASADDDSGNATGDLFHRAPRAVEGEGDQESRASSQWDREDEGRTERDADGDDPDRVAQEVAPVARVRFLDHPGVTMSWLSSSASTATTGLPRLTPSPAGAWQPATDAEPLHARPRSATGRPISSHQQARRLHGSVQRVHEDAGRTEHDDDGDDPNRVAQEMSPVAARAFDRLGDTSASLSLSAQAPTAALPRLRSSPVVVWQPAPKAEPMQAPHRIGAFRINSPGFVDVDDLIGLPADAGHPLTSVDLDDLVGLHVQCQQPPQQQPLPHLDRSELVSFVTQDTVSKRRARQEPLPSLEKPHSARDACE